MPTSSQTVLLLSGGLDSAVTLGMLHAEGRTVHALTVEYGQRHAVELARARALASHYGVAHRTVTVDLRALGGSALTDEIDVPKDRQPGAGGIPATYVPARNTILLSLALAWAEVVNAGAIAIGVNAVDYSGYPDCRPEYLTAFRQLTRLATRMGVETGSGVDVIAPLSGLNKAEIIRRGVALGVPLALTHSCYDPVGDLACGRCDSCRIRRNGFEAAGVPDPTRYAASQAAVGL
ncbi:MAG: 7-cyano-7-deazaguanine synthase QueC [Nitrospirota bacterium]